MVRPLAQDYRKGLRPTAFKRDISPRHLSLNQDHNLESLGDVDARSVFLN